MDCTEIKAKLAVVILAYGDYESLEISLAVHSKFFPHNIGDGRRVKFFILQNGRGTYDCERSLQVAQRYKNLFPRDIEVITDIPSDAPYTAILKLLQDKRLEKYDYIIKLDDDVFPLTGDWLDNLSKTYAVNYNRLGDKLAYVTGLVNNNPFGFKKTIEIMGLENMYYSTLAREHVVGIDYDLLMPSKVIPKDCISTNGGGTVWRYPYLARFIHEETTLKPDAFIAQTQGLGTCEVNNKERYSINCMLFRKEFWKTLSECYHSSDDELMCFKYCMDYERSIIAALNVPMVHLCFCVQRFENKDLLPIIRDYYDVWLKHSFKIGMCYDREIENEARLQYLEKKVDKMQSSLIYPKLKNMERKIRHKFK